MNSSLFLESILEKQNKIIKEFEKIESWDDRYKKIIEMGKLLPLMDNKLKTSENKIKGCQSDVWLSSHFSDGRVFFQADSNSSIVKGLIALLINVFDQATPEAILKSNHDFLAKIELQKHLSPTRSNGLMAFIKQIKIYALAFSLKKS